MLFYSLSVVQWFSAYSDFARVFGDIFDLHNSGRTANIVRPGTRDAVKHLTLHRQDLVTKYFLSQNVNNEKAEKSCYLEYYIC